MATTYPAPKDTTVEALLGGLVSVPTHVSRAPSADPERDAHGLFAEFVNDDDQVAALAFIDHDVVNYVGGVMAAVEVETLQEASAKSAMHEASVESFREVVNVFASCLNSDYTPNVRLANIHPMPNHALTDEVKQLWRAPRGRRVYRVSVEDFGSGQIILYLA